MGSFNTTCAISNAPIRDGDKVRLFFLKSNADDNNGCSCYPHDDFQIVGGIALKATYADYNNYELEDENSIQAQYILSLLKEDYLENIPEPGVKYNEYHDHMSVKVEDLDFEVIQNMMHSGRFFVQKYYGSGKSFIAAMAVHESIFEVVKAKSYENHELDKANNNVIYTTITLEDEIAKEIAANSGMTYEQYYQAAYKKILDRHKDKLGGENTEKVLELVESLAEFEAEEKSSGLYDPDSHRYEFIANRRNPIKYMARFLREQKKLESAEDVEAHDIVLSDEEMESIVRSACEVRFFNIGMYTNNLMYRPIMTSGQEHDFAAHAQFLHDMADAISAIPSPWGDDESMSTKMHKELWQEVTITELKERYEEWYDDEAAERLQPIIDKMGDSEMIVIQPSEWSWREDPLDIYDIFDNKSVELRILNK